MLIIAYPGFYNYIFFLENKKPIHKCLYLQQAEKITLHVIAKQSKDTLIYLNTDIQDGGGIFSKKI